MAAFQEHVSIAVVSVGIVIVPFHSMGFLNMEQSLVALFFGILGGVAPDLDSDTSKPLQSIFKILSISLPLLFLLSFETTFSVLKILLLWGIFGFILKMVFFKIFLSLTQHRGIFHTVAMGVLFAELSILLCYKFFHVAVNIAFIYGFFMFFGFFIHLLLDELYSVNILGVRMKKSFGTALKFYDKNNKMGSLILYILIISLWLILPDSGKFFSSVEEALSGIRFL